MASNNMVVDTGIFIEYLRAKDKRDTTLFSISKEGGLFISSVTIYELYMGATTEEKKEDVRQLIKGPLHYRLMIMWQHLLPEYFWTYAKSTRILSFATSSLQRLRLHTDCL